MKGRIVNILKNRWFKLGVASAAWLLWFVVWTGNLWLLLGLPVIYDLYVSRLMHRYIWSRHRRRKERSIPYKKTMEWVEAIIFATVVATLVRIFFFEMYVIPSSSMEKTLLIGDYLCVSKTAYGPKIPNTPVAFPFVHHTMPFAAFQKSYSEIIRWPYHRLSGLGGVKRGDAVVFNFPAGDTVLLEMQDRTYYDVLRDYQANYGVAEGRRMLNSQYTVVSRPVDKRENYIKRCVGVPGDTLAILHGDLTVNGKPFPAIPNMQFLYTAYTNGTPLNRATLTDMGIANDDIIQNYGAYSIFLTRGNAERIASMANVTEMHKYESESAGLNIFPNDPQYVWNEDNFGPLWVPARGATVGLDSITMPLYKRIIEVYEGHKLETRSGAIYIDGQPADNYTFGMNYYFMMGDNRHNSADSRFWGFVPEDHVVGKASFVWLSLDKDKGWFSGKLRWRRMFRAVR